MKIFEKFSSKIAFLGRVEVKVGAEHLLFQSGPFTYFGISVLGLAHEMTTPLQSPVLSDRETLHPPGSFIPDFTVYPVSDLLYLYISRSQYVAAFRASLVERTSIPKVDAVTGAPLENAPAAAADWNKALQLKRLSIAGSPADAATTAAALKRTSLLAQSNVSLNQDGSNTHPPRRADAKTGAAETAMEMTAVVTANPSATTVVNGGPPPPQGGAPAVVKFVRNFSLR